jgi:hypothetical protein
MSPYATPPEDRPTRDDEEHWTDPRESMVRCQYGCPTWFHGHDTAAAVAHYRAHGAEVAALRNDRARDLKNGERP